MSDFVLGGVFMAAWLTIGLTVPLIFARSYPSASEQDRHDD